MTIGLASISLDGLATLFAAMAAGFAALIAWLEHKRAQRQFINDTYDRRVPVFHAAQEFMDEVHKRGYVRWSLAHKFRIETSHAEFLFGPDVIAALKAMHNRAHEMAKLREKLYPSDNEQGLPRGDERSRAVAEEREMFDKLTSEDWQRAYDAFKRYLSIA